MPKPNELMTSAGLAGVSGISQQSIQRYAKWGLLEYTELANGVRLFHVDQAESARRIKAARLKNRGIPQKT